MNTKLKGTLLINIFCMICIGVFCSVHVFAQKSDSIYYNARSRKINKVPEIRANIQSFRPNYKAFGFIPYNSLLLNSKSSNVKQDKILNVIKVYPNPVDDQINVTLRLERATNLSVKIMDLLGNEVITLSNERTSAGEQTKSYTLPNRLNSGIYFLRIVAGAETIVKRISVL